MSGAICAESPTTEGLDLFLSLLTPRRKRSIHEFSEEEIILPKGPRKGFPFRIDYMPMTRFILDAMEDPRWKKVAIVGPTQSGKSLLATNLPMLYYLFEQEQDVIFGIPSMDLARGVWAEKIEPVIRKTRYRDFLPNKGPGSRGGNPTAIQLGNGVTFRFMGAGGGDDQRSSHTAKYIIMTEVDKMDDVGEASEEADPVSQIEMRADAFEDSKIIMECTVTGEEGRIWQEAMVLGSGAEIYVQCPRCQHYQTLRTSQIVCDESDEISAEATAAYKCEACESLLTEDDRLTMLDEPMLLHRGQTINKDGVIEGEIPKTRTFGMHYNVLYSPMQTLGKTAAQRLRAEKSNTASIRKAFRQSKEALPWTGEDEDVQELTPGLIVRRSEECDVALGNVPAWAKWVVMTCDMQKRLIYWHADAWAADGTSQVVEYGYIEIAEDLAEAGIKRALNEMHDISASGFSGLNNTTHIPRIRLIDTGYRPDVIYPWLHGRPEWRGVKGYGHSADDNKRPSGEKAAFEIPGVLQIRRQTDGNFIWFIDVDCTKGIVHDRYFIPPGTACHTIIPNGVARSYANSICAEKREWDSSGSRYKWVKVPGRRRNDFLDCRSYSVAAAMYLHMQDEDEPKATTKNKQAVQTPQSFISWGGR